MVLLEGLLSEEVEAYPIGRDLQFACMSIFAFQYAYSEMLRKRGAKPYAVFGSSVGEVAAAVFVGSMSVEDAVQYIATRFQLIQGLDPCIGAMEMVFSPESAVRKVLETAKLPTGESVCVGWVSPDSTTLSGHIAAVHQVVKLVGAKSVKIPVDWAIHSQLCAPILPELREILSTLCLKSVPPDAPSVVSGFSGDVARFENVDYWLLHDKDVAINNARAMEELWAIGCNAFLEVGHKPHVVKMVQKSWKDRKGLTFLYACEFGLSETKCLWKNCRAFGLAVRDSVRIQPQSSANALCLLPAVNQAELVRSGRISARTLTEAHIARIECLDGGVNAVCIKAFESARQRATLADEALQRGEVWGPLHGVPITVKANVMVSGLPCNVGGNPEFEGFIPEVSGLVVQRFVGAGAVILGKTNCPLYLDDYQTYNPKYGKTSNPWDVSRTPGGSSGGSAAALASGFTALELGTDMAGSIRQPAHYCGVCCHKPSYGLGHMHGCLPEPNHRLLDARDYSAQVPNMPYHFHDPSFRHLLTVSGPLARCCADLELAFKLMCKPEPIMMKGGWSYSPPPPTCANVKALRVAAWLDFAPYPTDRSYLELLEAATAALENAGASVDRAAKPFPEEAEALKYHQTFRKTRKYCASMELGFAAIPGHPRANSNYTRLESFSNKDIATMIAERSAIKQHFESLFEKFDILLTPVFPMPADPHNQTHRLKRTYIGEGIPEFGWKGLTFWPCWPSIADLPATVVPVGRTAAGLPCGIQIVAAQFMDLTSIEVGKMLEQLHPPSNYQPPPGFTAVNETFAATSRL